ncbi:hypothetical protein CFOL_v3_30425, partial [Cephalotus follicularis]
VKSCMFWPHIRLDPLEPPPFKIMPGRPTEMRRKDQLEPKRLKVGKLNRTRRIMTCAKCGSTGHNKRGFKEVVLLCLYVSLSLDIKTMFHQIFYSYILKICFIKCSLCVYIEFLCFIMQTSVNNMFDYAYLFNFCFFIVTVENVSIDHVKEAM